MSGALRVFGVALFGAFALACLALAPVTFGFTLVPGIPALLLAVWLARNDPADAPDIGWPGVVALLLAVAAMAWVFLSLWRDTDISGRPH